MDKRKLTKVAVTTAATASVSLGIGTSLFMHRSETHEAIKLHPAIRQAARFIVWAGGGMKPREWVGVHLKHHDNEDLPDDPHSPVQNGRFGVLKVLLGNVPMYRQAAKEISQTGAYPERLKPDALDKHLYDKGLLGQVALYGLMARINGPVYGAAALGLHDLIMFGAGGIVNGLGHSGSGNMLKALVNRPEPNEDGSYSRNLNPGLTALTFGEGRHANHHADPSNWQLGNNLMEDPAALIASGLIKTRLATSGHIVANTTE